MILVRLRNLREDADYTQEYIAHILNVSQRAYSRYENGERAIPLASLCTLADLYQTSVDYLLNRTDCKEPYPPSLGENRKALM